MKKLIPLLIMIGAASCQSDGFHTRENRTLTNLTEEQLGQRLGAEYKSCTNTVGQFARSPEPESARTRTILTLYPTNKAGNLSVPIKTMSWVKNRIVTTAWLHHTNGVWISFYAEDWNMDSLE